MDFLFKFATRGRAAKFISCIDNIKSLLSGRHNYSILVTLDEDDPDFSNYQKEYGKIRDKTNIYFANVKESQGKVYAINYGVNEFTENWDCLVNYSDDMVFIVRGWDDILHRDIQNIFGNSSDWFAHYNDGYTAEKLPTMSIMGKDYYDRFKYIYHPLYKSFSCDAEAMYVSMMLGKHRYFSRMLFKHLHYSNIQEKIDSTYMKNDEAFTYDTDIYFKRMNDNFDITNPICVPFENEKRR
jgi:hypothetical protein